MKRKSAIRFKRVTIFAALAALLLLSTIPAYGQVVTDQQTIVSFGDSRIYNDPSSAKRAAISEGLRFSVQKAAAGLLPTEALIENFELIAGILEDQRDSFIQDYRILREYRTDKYYRVLIQATVSNQKIQDAFHSAGLQAAPERLPAVLFMIAEKDIDDIGYEYWWRKGYLAYTEQKALSPIKNIFQQNGFPIIAPSADDITWTEFFSDLDLDAEPADYQAAILGNRLGADVVLVGKATAEATANRMGEDIRTFKATVKIHVINAATGEEMTMIREQALTVSEDPEKGSKNALADAGYRAGKQLANRLTAIWQNAVMTADKFMITVRGKDILPHLESLRQSLKQQPGVSSLKTTEMSADAASLAVDYEGTAQELANNLLMQSFDGFGINISELSEDGMAVELMSD